MFVKIYTEYHFFTIDQIHFVKSLKNYVYGASVVMYGWFLILFLVVCYLFYIVFLMIIAI
ncbi:hypothetical protein VRK_39840 [Vibrio sp. MEBiC08052]|nr:hypothetical protein VRK_39840 [Vibrio sp. MEBiC08052]